MDQKRDPEASEKSAASPVDAAPKARDKHSPDGVALQSDGSLQKTPAKEPQVKVTPSAPPPAAPPPAPPAQPAPEKTHQVRWSGILLRLLIIAMAAGLAFLIATSWDKWVANSIIQSTDNAYLQADKTPVSARVNGYVRDVLIEDYQLVQAGDLLAQIDDDVYRAQLAEAEANVEGARASIENVETQKALQKTLIEQAAATIEATEADLIRYRLESARQRELLGRDFASKQKVEEAQANEKRSKAMLAVNRAQLDQQRQQMNVLESQELTARAVLKAREAARDSARINLGYTRIVAPIAGMVGQRQVKPGQYASTGMQVTWIVPLQNVWVLANYKETQMTRIRVGQPATISIDSFPDLKLKGHVVGWSPATGAQFSLLPPDNATGNFTKVVQRIPVKIALAPDSNTAGLFRPGMSVIATIDTSSLEHSPGTAAGGGP